MTLLSAWGVDEPAEALYRAALRHPASPPEELAARLGWDAAAVRRAARPLLATGLAREVNGVLVAAAPAVALEGLLDGEQARLEQRLDRVAEARLAVADFVADHLAGQATRWDHETVEVVRSRDVLQVTGDLALTSTGPLRCANTCVGVPGGGDDELQKVTLRLLRDGRELRALYPLEVLADPAQAERLAFWEAHGEQGRLVAEVPRPFTVFGDEALLAPLDDPGTVGQRSVVVRTPSIIALAIACFDGLWERGVPPSGSGDSPPDPAADHAPLLQLLAAGMKDEAIARYLGVSVRTVRRRVADTMMWLGASTRFQAGREAARRGLI